MVLDQPNTHLRFLSLGFLIQGNKYFLTIWVPISLLKLKVNIKMQSYGSCPRGWFREAAGGQAPAVGQAKLDEIGSTGRRQTGRKDPQPFISRQAAGSCFRRASGLPSSPGSSQSTPMQFYKFHLPRSTRIELPDLTEARHNGPHAAFPEPAPPCPAGTSGFVSGIRESPQRL